MVVDDDKEMVSTLRLILTMAGAEVIEAYSGMSGYIMTKRELPDVVVLDIMMPDIDGYEVCRKLKLDPKTRHIPIIFLSARTGQGHIERGLSLGAQGYITKPFMPSDLLTKIFEITESGDRVPRLT